MTEIYRKLEWLSKEDLIKRVVSHEFNRFSEYYRNRSEIEQPSSDSRGDRTMGRDARDSRGERGSRQAKPGFSRLFINLGKTDNFFAHELIGLLNSNTHSRVDLGRIDLMKNYSFFEVAEKETKTVLKALGGLNWEGRKIVVEVAGEESGEGRKRSSSQGDFKRDRPKGGYREKKEDSYKKNDFKKSAKPNREERGYDSARGPKKPDNWKQFFKEDEPDFSEEGWARRKPKK